MIEQQSISSQKNVANSTVPVSPPDREFQELVIDALVPTHYQIISLLGTGGMSRVYKARHLLLNKVLAIKILLPHLSMTGLKRFQQEAKAVSTLNNVHVIKVYEFAALVEGQPYMVMDYVEGRTLAEYLKEYGQLSMDQSLTIFRQICEGLAHAHENGVLHRDLKPSNIMLEGANNLVKIVDFGIAKLTGDGHDLTRSGDVFGSPLYMSPEQAQGKRVDVRSDIYSLGCVFFEVLTGACPHQGDSAFATIFKHCNDQPLSLKEASLGKDFPEQLEILVHKMLIKNPEERFQSVAAVIAALEEVKQSVQKKDLGRLTPAIRRPLARHGQLILVACLLLLGSASIFTFSKHAIQPQAAQNVAVQKQLDLGTTPSEVVSILLADPRSEHVNFSGASYLVSDEDLEPLKNFHMMSELRISNAPTIDGSFLKYIVHNGRLSVLDLSDSNMNDQSMKYLASLSRLCKLSLNNTSISNLEPLKGLTRLDEVKLSRTHINDDSLRFLPATVRLLVVTDTKIGDKGLANLPDGMNLRGLTVDDTKVTDASLQHLYRFKRLHSLSLAGTHITDAAISQLTKFQSLEAINLSHTKITNKGIMQFAKSTNLSSINLTDCSKISRQYIAKLQKQLPDCKITTSEEDKFTLQD